MLTGGQARRACGFGRGGTHRRRPPSAPAPAARAVAAAHAAVPAGLSVIGATTAAHAARLAVRLGRATAFPIVLARSGGVALLAARGAVVPEGRAALRAAAAVAAASPFLAAEDDGEGAGACCPADAWPNLVAAAGEALGPLLRRCGGGGEAASFAFIRADAEAVRRAWGMLALGEEADGDQLARRWRCLAFALDPARGDALSRRLLDEAGRAHALLRALAARAATQRFSRGALIAVAGGMVVVPAARGAGARGAAGA